MADSTYTDTYANIPAASSDGDLFFPSDGRSVYRDTGAAWMPWGPICPMTDPPAAGWSWVNQGGATVSTTNGGIYLETLLDSQYNLRAYVRAAPTPPYVITGRFTARWEWALRNDSVGLCWRESGTGKMIYHAFSTTSWMTSISKLTNPTTFSAHYLNASYVAHLSTRSIFHYRIADDNTNRICSVSNDGHHWAVLHTVGRTDFLTADEVGICLSMSAIGTNNLGMWLLSWEVT